MGGKRVHRQEVGGMMGGGCEERKREDKTMGYPGGGGASSGVTEMGRRTGLVG